MADILDKITMAIIRSELTTIQPRDFGFNPDDARAVAAADIIFYHPNNRFEKDILNDASKTARTIFRMFNAEGLVISRKRKNVKTAS